MISFSELLKEWYKNKNYKIIDLNNESKICFVFLSSNGLFSGNEEHCTKQLIENRYDWENISKSKKIRKKAGRLIFIRDIKSCSYVEGINDKINTIDEIIKLVEQLTKGYEIYFVGNSAGGYLAMILGIKISNTKRIYSFGGLFSLYNWTGSHNTLSFSENEIFMKHINEDVAKYYNITNLVNSCTKDIYHIYASGHLGDSVQIKTLNNINKKVHIFGFKTKIHGRGLNGFDYPDFLSASNAKILRICRDFENKENIKKNWFSIKSFGLINFLSKYTRKIYQHYFKKRI